MRKLSIVGAVIGVWLCATVVCAGVAGAVALFGVSRDFTAGVFTASEVIATIIIVVSACKEFGSGKGE